MTVTTEDGFSQTHQATPINVQTAPREQDSVWITMLGQMGHLVCGYSLLIRVSDMPRPLVRKFIYQIWKENEYKIIQTRVV